MTRVVAVVSGKGGAGKTVVAANLAVALSRLGKKVLVLDSNVSGSNLGLHLGIVQPEATLNDVLAGRKSLADAAYEYKGLYVVPASLAEMGAELENLKSLLSGLLGYLDFIVLDAAAGVASEVEAAVRAADDVLLVTNPEAPALTNAVLARDLARLRDKEVVGIVLNRTRGESWEFSPEKIEKFLHLPVLSVLPDHRHVRESIAAGVPVVDYSPDSPVSKEIIRLADAISS